MKSGWQKKKLGEVCAFLNRGVSPKYLDTGGIRVLNQRCVRDHSVSYEQSRRHDVRAKKVAAERLLQAGDVLVNSTGIGTLGRVAQLREQPTEPTTADSHVTIVRPKPDLFYPDFFGYALITIEESIQEAGEGCGGQTELARSILAERFLIRFPESLPEQKRIVGILDKAFEAIATAKANAEENLQNVRALFESYLDSVFTARGVGWIEKRLDEIGNTQTGSTPKTSDRNNYGDYIPFVKPADFKVDGSLNFGNDGLSKKGLSEAREVSANSVLMVCIGATIGKCGYCERDITTNQQINALTPTDGSSHRFLYYQMLTQAFQRKVIHGSAQATLPIINKSKWSAIPLWLPPTVEDQERIVEKLDDLVAKTQHLGNLYERKLDALEALKKTILREAFSGGL